MFVYTEPFKALKATHGNKRLKTKALPH